MAKRNAQLTIWMSRFSRRKVTKDTAMRKEIYMELHVHPVIVNLVKKMGSELWCPVLNAQFMFAVEVHCMIVLMHCVILVMLKDQVMVSGQGRGYAGNSYYTHHNHNNISLLILLTNQLESE